MALPLNQQRGLSISQKIQVLLNQKYLVLYLRPLSKEFIDLYCNEIDTVCCDDASIIISTKSLVERILKWGEIVDKSSELKYAKIAESEFKDNLYLSLHWTRKHPCI